MLDNEKFIPIHTNPIDLFKIWFELAIKSETNNPNAMTLSSISDQYKPNSRIVLLKYFDNKGFIFYTNSNSKKGKDIAFNSFVSLNFYWKTQKKQIRIEGEAEIINSKDANEYFNSRPRESQIGALASNQSAVLSDRSLLIKKTDEIRKKYENIEIPRPNYWNGYLVKPNLIEFWQEMQNRLHDRVEYKKIENKWVSNRLFP